MKAESKPTRKQLFLKMVPFGMLGGVLHTLYEDTTNMVMRIILFAGFFLCVAWIGRILTKAERRED